MRAPGFADLSEIMHMDAILAIDTGGTKCDAILALLDGTVIGSGNCAIPGIGGRAERAMVDAVWEALTVREFDRLAIGAIHSVFPMSVMRKIKARHIEIVPCMEHEGAFALAGENFGIVALAGTGAFVNGRNRAGKEFKVDGMGPFLGDYGSGYQIGLLALRAVVRTDFHPRHATSLRQPVLSTFAVDSTRNLLSIDFASSDRSQVARLARMVDEHASAGDPVAIQILLEAATGMANNIRDVAESLDMLRDDYPVVATGSVICHSELYWSMLVERLRVLAPRLQPRRNASRAVCGIALFALASLHDDEPPGMRQRLLSTVDHPVDPKSLVKPLSLASVPCP